ncbi:VanZ family protein [Gudongella sp. DL1XJH-153]|uniref:VanZ family protein n=1 Tax=Gudongella sp. DL1XJH-153 TaxID=3409804 RepID=UPI003BB52BE4
MFGKKTPWLLVLAWMAIIFYLSSQQAADSNQLSTGITKIIVDLISGVFPGLAPQVQWLNHIVRKNAHFIAYFILGLLQINALYVNGLGGRKAFITALAICFLYAVSDEFHQTFVPGRSGELRDVIIDSMGSLTAIGIYTIGRVKFRKSNI